ncbi:tartrate dehydrogenase [Ornithinimicrobium sp. CNJ-824]|uniref:tartrate dehydrogenase n=1 Tax=Ornithinimicrobium sp. CNJ-824 TaxID=1904966 RepID=UPI00095C2368|nr:tartrate dehydrogenase [Ornithinimicrobium sp. CNJ-824]OLT20661.1 tartrate dehydrogenase [Ornithinimicrobium sp. CNJ-824]
MGEQVRVAVIPGDGIGTEVMEPTLGILEAVGRRHGITFAWQHHDWSCEHYTRTGRMMPEDGLEQLAQADQILLGAVGYPGVPDHVSLWGLLIPIRRAFRQYINLRPVRLLPGIECPLRLKEGTEIDFLVVRENNEGEYSEVGGRMYRGTPEEFAVQESVFTRRGVERAARYALDLAASRRGGLASATKSNGIIHTMPFWDEVVHETAKDYPGVEVRDYHIDALSAMFVLDPGRFDVVVASNLFGDILTDLGAAIIGSIGIAPSGNLNPEGEHPSMFEPVHGSAPDIAGQGIANPLGQIWAASMMLDHMGHPQAAAELVSAMEATLTGGVRTPDLGGTASTTEVADAVLQQIGSDD